MVASGRFVKSGILLSAGSIRIVICSVVLALLILLPASTRAQDTLRPKEPGYMSVSSGIYSCLDLWASTVYVNLQWQPGLKIWVLRPQVGALVTGLGAGMIYGGLVWPARPVKWLVIQTGAAAGYYQSGSGINLEFPLEFRLTLAVLFNFRNSAQLGLEFSHISNANLKPPNPGTEAFSVIFQFPLQTGR